MCGIAGIVAADDAQPANEVELDVLLASLEARGPDGEGRFLDGPVALGMRRLAIVDLDGGTQPFSAADGRVITFINGEIYNFRELRRELETHGARFRSRCDGEVVPHGYVTWGWEGLLQRLEGMFAICLYDATRRQLFLARDPLGEKPLLYHHDQRGGFLFASQLSSLLGTGRVPLRPNAAALNHYLAVHYVPGDLTIIDGVRKLPPGHMLTLRLADRRVEVRRYAPLLGSAGNGHSLHGRLPRRPAEAAVAVREALEHSVKLRVYADVPVGLFLSGGVDSSVLASVVRRVGAPVTHSFSVGVDDSALDESPHALRVAAHLGLEHHHLRFGLQDFDGLFDDAIQAMDEPTGDAALVPTLALSRAAKSFVKVVLSGEGADEVFAGYGYYEAPRPWHRLRLWPGRNGTDHAEGLYRSDAEALSGFPLLAGAAERATLLGGPPSVPDSPYLQTLAASLRAEPDPLRRMQRADLMTWLPDDLLMKLDRATMATSIEGRVPYLAPALTDLGLRLPASWKVHHGTVKWILREAFRADLPREITKRRKQGFVLPVRRWLLGPGREQALALSHLDQDDGLQRDAVAALMARDIAAGAGRERLLFALVVYRRWMQHAAALVRRPRASPRDDLRQQAVK